MERISMIPRDGWQETIKRQGLVYNDAVKDGRTVHYWNENAAYQFSMAEVLHLEKVTDNLHRMSLEAARFLAAEQRNPGSPFAQMGISPEGLEYAIESLNRNDPDLYGRFDLVYSDPSTPAKMLEYNADTPTGLVEGSIVQWYWFEDMFINRGKTGYDQWNGLHEALVNRFAKYRDALRHDVHTNPNPKLHFGYTALDDSGEDVMTVEYLRDCAIQAGFTARDALGETIYDANNNPLPMAQRIEMTQIGFNWDTNGLWTNTMNRLTTSSSCIRGKTSSAKNLVSPSAILSLGAGLSRRGRCSYQTRCFRRLSGTFTPTTRIC